MNKRYLFVMLAIITILLIIDLYAFTGLHLVSSGINNNKIRSAVHWGYWIITLSLLSTIILTFLFAPHERDPRLMNHFFLLGGIALAIYLPKLFFIAFHLTEDIGKFISMGIARILPHGPESFSVTLAKISKVKFLSQAGLVLSLIPMFVLIMGMVRGRFDFKVTYQPLVYSSLPQEFDNFRMVQISDLHIGSFYGNEEKVKKAIEMVNQLHPDLLVFTGDLVNNYVEEMNGWVPILSQLQARYGKYSILGNHDYGDYYRWESLEAKNKNLQELKDIHHEIGFRLLLNETVPIERNGQKFNLVGVENWGKPPFAQYGNFRKAIEGVDTSLFTVLLSHDPSHWDAEIVGKTKVELTLSGHTHGFQFGFRIGNSQWSPIQWKYRRWNGMYREGKQVLYVNRGLGYIGYPGRVGMLPEITVFDLKKE
jgi:predicted MPP superfamily phosphohydrolase